MNVAPGAWAGLSAPWYRVVAIPDICHGGSQERDYASVLPAVLDAAQNHRPFMTGWLSRGGAPLELITNAGPLPARREPRHPYAAPQGDLPSGAHAGPGADRCELLFPWGAKGVPCADSVAADLDRMVWAPCLGRQAPLGDAFGSHGSVRTSWTAPAASSPWPGGEGLAPATASLFEVALTTLMGRPF